MTLLKQALLILLSAALFMACNSTKVVMDYDKNAPFDSYKTFKFLPWSEKNSELINELDRDRLYAACKSELNRRGMKEVEGDPDVFVNILVIISKETGVNAYTDYYSPYGYYYGYGYGYSTTRYSEYEYLKGSLIVDLFDSREKKLVWQGTAITEIQEGSSSPEKREAGIKSIMKKIFFNYPVRPTKG